MERHSEAPISQKELHKIKLLFLSPYLVRRFLEEDAEIMQFGIPTQVQNDRRFNCDVCSASIFDVFYVGVCRHDVCIHCAADIRNNLIQPECATCRSPANLQIHRLLPPGALHRVAGHPRTAAAFTQSCRAETLALLSPKPPCPFCRAIDPRSPELRRCANRGLPDDLLWSPTFEQVQPVPGAGTPAEALAHFEYHWSRREPVVVRECPEGGGMWEPEELGELVRESRVVNCTTGEEEVMDMRGFFATFRGTRRGPLLKLRDWPAHAALREVAPEHVRDFARMLPFPEVTSEGGALNVAAAMEGCVVRPDLGPKFYVADGRGPEAPCRDSVTKLHTDASCAANVLVRCFADGQRTGADGPAGAIWHIFRMADHAALRAWLLQKRAARELKYTAAVVGNDPWVYLLAAELDALKRETGIEPWQFEQREREAVLIPCGSPHQARTAYFSLFMPPAAGAPPQTPHPLRGPIYKTLP